MPEIKRKISGYCPQRGKDYFIYATYPNRKGWQRALTLHCEYRADNKCSELKCPIEKIADRQMI